MIKQKKLPVIYLASASPRRSELLERMGLPFIVKPVEVDETMNSGAPGKLARDLSELKMNAFLFENMKFNPQWVITSDTFVNYHRKNIGKPENRDDAFKMISFLSGKKHTVYTAISLYSSKNSETGNRITTKIAKTGVRFSRLTPQQIEQYIDTDEWKGVAGSYRIQEKGEMLIKKISGPFSNVMGLPVNLLWQMLLKAGYYD